MATFLFRDANKAAFINGANKLFKDNELNFEISQDDLIDTPSPDKVEFTIYVTDDPQTADVLKNAEKSKYFSFPFRKIDMKEMVSESKKANKAKKSKK